MKRLASLRVRLVLWTVALQGVFFLLFSLFLIGQLNRSRATQTDETLALTSAQLISLIETTGTGYAVPDAALAELQTRGLLAWLVDDAGETVYAVGAAGLLPPPRYTEK